MDKQIIQNLKNSWRNCNNASTEFLSAIPAARLQEKPFNTRFTAFSWEFACIVRTRLVYLNALRGDELNFGEREDVPGKDQLQAKSKSELLETLSQASKGILAEIEHLHDPNGMNLVEWLLQHERIHHGKIVLYLSQTGLPLPESFVKTWGESNFRK